MLKMKILAASAAVVALTVTAHAQNIQTMELASNLGNVLASEKACGLTYDQDAIQHFIEEKVPADDMSFVGNLNLMTRGAERQVKSLGASSKTAHCAQIRRVAKAYKFIK